MSWKSRCYWSDTLSFCYIFISIVPSAPVCVQNLVYSRWFAVLYYMCVNIFIKIFLMKHDDLLYVRRLFSRKIMVLTSTRCVWFIGHILTLWLDGFFWATGPLYLSQCNLYGLEFYFHYIMKDILQSNSQIRRRKGTKRI